LRPHCETVTGRIACCTAQCYRPREI